MAVEFELFDRQAQTVVAPVDGGEGIDVTGLRTVFRCERTSTSEPNTSTIEVYNLAPNSRNRIESKDQFVILRAGYRDLTRQVCSGVIKRVEHRREGVDIVTEMELKDGGIALLEPEFKRAYSRGTSRRKIVSDIISSMPGVSRGRIEAAGILGSIPKKAAFSTTCKLALDRLSKSWGFEWSIQDGTVQVLDVDGTLEGQETAVVVSPDTGLLSSPARTGQEGARLTNSRSRSQRPGAKFRTLLLPQLFPGVLVQLQSEFVSGFFKVQSVEHNGDTYGNPWTSDVEAVQI